MSRACRIAARAVKRACAAARDVLAWRGMNHTAPDEAASGYRRRIRIEPQPGVVAAMLEDDIHCLAVILRHDGERVLAVEPLPHRMPWNTCPAAGEQLVATFAGRPLAEVTARREKRANCTHLHDMAVLAAAHAGDTAPIDYAIDVSDPVDGGRVLEVRRNGALLHRWLERDGMLTEPAAIAGQPLFTLRDWINSLEGEAQEAARLLQWGGLVAHGRTMPLDQQSNAAELPANCYTLQPERAVHARRIGERFDFSEPGERAPLADLAGLVRARMATD